PRHFPAGPVASGREPLPWRTVQVETAAATAWGVEAGYHDIGGRWVEADPETVAAVLEAMGADGAGPPPSPALVVRTGEPAAIGGPFEVVTEDAAVVAGEGWLPTDLPPGYHTLRDLAAG